MPVPDWDPDRPSIRVLMVKADPTTAQPRVTFTVDLLTVPDWIRAGYVPVMYDLEDVQLFAAWERGD